MQMKSTIEKDQQDRKVLNKGTKSSTKDIAQLAIFGGNPAFDDVLHVGRPNLGERKDFIAKINDILNRKWLTNNGPYVQEFERRVAELLNVKHCISMCNGTIALEIAAKALGLTGEVIMPSFTFMLRVQLLQRSDIFFVILIRLH